MRVHIGSGTRLGIGLALWLEAVVCLAADVEAQPRMNRHYCASEGTNLMLVIDVTTQYDEKDKHLLVRAVTELFDSLRGGERFVIRSITSSFSTSNRLIDTCIPHCSAKGLLDELFKCSQGRIVSDTRKVKQDIVRVLRTRLSKMSEQPRSDIIRTLVQISREEASLGHRKVLYLFSDLIENSENVTMRLFFQTDNRRLMRYLKSHNLIAQLEGVEVRAFGVGRGSSRERRPLSVTRYQKLLSFWKQYFAEAMAASVEISQNIIEHGP